MTFPSMNVPNLDSTADNDLLEFLLAIRQLDRCVRIVLAGREFRRVGDIAMAQKRERDADELYRQLPVWAQW